MIQATMPALPYRTSIVGAQVSGGLVFTSFFKVAQLFNRINRMRRFGLFFAIIFSFYGTLTAAVQSGTPSIASLYPNGGVQGTTLSAVIRGTGLDAATSVSFNVAGISATIDSGRTATSLPITVTIGPGVSVGVKALTLITPSGPSQPRDFIVTNAASPMPSINPLSDTAAAGISQSVAPFYGSPFVLTVNGRNLSPNSQVTANGAALNSTYVSSTRLTATVPTSALATVGTIDIAILQQDLSGNPLKSNTIGLRVIERGDVNGSRSVNISDALVVARSVGGLISEPQLSQAVGDINLSGSVNIGDALSLALFSGALMRDLATPAITQVSANPAGRGQTLTITGTGFGTKSSDVQVAFTNAQGVERVTPTLQAPAAGQSQSTSLTVTVPNSAVSGPIQIFRLDFSAGSQQYPLMVSGTQTPLLLASVNPYFPVQRGNSITLTGSGFTSPPAANLVSFKSALGLTSGTVTGGTVTDGTMSSLQVKVPDDAVCGGITVTTETGTSKPKPVLIVGTSCPLSLTGLLGAGAPGQIAVLEGTGFSRLSPGDNVVRFRSADGGTVIAPVMQAGETELQVRIPDSAIAGDVTVTVGANTSNAITFQAAGGPTLTQVNPSYGALNATVNVTITGTGFIPGRTTVRVSGTGVTVGAISVLNATSLTATFTIAAGASVDERSVTVLVDSLSSPALPFTVLGRPTLTKMAPPSMGQKPTIPVKLTGSGFVTGATIHVSGDTVGIADVNVTNLTTLTASFDTTVDSTDNSLVPQALIVSVTTPAGTSNALTFTVFPQPVLSIMGPNIGFQGQTVKNVGLQGRNFSLDPNENTINICLKDAVSGNCGVGDPGITVSDVTVLNENAILATFIVSPDAALGERLVTITTPGGTTDPQIFTVKRPPPTMTAMTPSFGIVGKSFQVTVTGTGFVPDVTSLDVRDDFFGLSGVTIGPIVVNSPTQLTTTFTISDNAPTAESGQGAPIIALTVGGEPAARGLVFYVLGNTPSLSSISPSLGYQGGSVLATLTGSGFATGATTVDAGPDILVSDVNVGGTTSLTATFTIAAGATTGPRNVRIKRTPEEAAIGPVTFTVNPRPAAPTLTGIDNASGIQGALLQTTLRGTNFVAGNTAVVVSGAGVIVTSVSVISSTSLNATLVLSGATGSYNVNVVTPGGSSGTRPLTINANTIANAAHFAVTHLAGSNGGFGSGDATGSAARFNQPEAVWGDGTNLYIADSSNHTIRKMVLATQVVTTVAGMPGVSGPVNGVGTAARFNSPKGIWGDGANLYVTEANHTVRKIVLATGDVTTLAGSAGISGSKNGTGTDAQFDSPYGIWGDGANLYVADQRNCTIRRIVIATALVSTFAGSVGNCGVANSPQATFTSPAGIWGDGTYLFVTESRFAAISIRRIRISTGDVTTITGTGDAAFTPLPRAIWGDSTNLYFAGNDIKKMPITGGTVTVIAGLESGTGMWGDGTNLYVADALNHRIRKVAIANGATTTVAGAAIESGFADATVGADARFNSPTAVWTDGSNLYVADSSNARIRKVVIATGSVSTLAGPVGLSNSQGIWGDGINLYVDNGTSLFDNAQIKKIAIAPPNGITTIAGGDSGFADGTGEIAQFNSPAGMWSDGTNLYVADSSNNVIRKVVLATGVVTTFAGSGAAGWTNGASADALFSSPTGVWGDGVNLYVADSGNKTIRKVVIATGLVTTIAGSPGATGTTDGTGAQARFGTPYSIWGDGTNLYVSDTLNHNIRKIAIATGVVTTLAGSRRGSEDGIDSAAAFNSPRIWGDGSNLYIADRDNHSIRKMTPVSLLPPAISSISPSSAAHGTTLAVTITGTNFVPGGTGTTVSIDDSSIHISSVTVTGPGTLIANFEIPSTAPAGTRNVTVTTSAGSQTVSFPVN